MLSTSSAKNAHKGYTPDVQDIRARFGADVEAAAAGKLGSWQEGYDALAFIILGDQFTRYRPSSITSHTA